VGLAVYRIPGYPLVRKVYLLLVAAVLGFIFNLTFSYLHLSQLLGLKVFSFAKLSHVLLCLLPIVLGLFFGQFWCGWLCPFGALQELINFKSLRQNISAGLDRRARYFKYIFLAALILVFTVTGSVNIFSSEPLSVLFFNPLNLIWQKSLAILALVFSLFYLRFWCRYFCASGAFLSLFNRIGIFKDRSRAGCCISAGSCRDLDCIECNQCAREHSARRIEQDVPRSDKNKDNLFKGILIFTLLVMAVTFAYSFKFQAVKSEAVVGVEPGIIKYETIDAVRLKKMIGQGELSEKEAGYYKEVKN
jgi:polyferredoxin